MATVILSVLLLLQAEVQGGALEGMVTFKNVPTALLPAPAGVSAGRGQSVPDAGARAWLFTEEVAEVLKGGFRLNVPKDGGRVVRKKIKQGNKKVWIEFEPVAFTVVDGTGKFALEGIPPGHYVLVVWSAAVRRVFSPALERRNVEIREGDRAFASIEFWP